MLAWCKNKGLLAKVKARIPCFDRSILIPLGIVNAIWMANTSQLVDSIADRLQTVVEQMKQLQQENQSLHERLEHAKQELVQKQGSIRELKMKLEAAQTAKSIKGVGQSSAKAKTQIDKLIGEIDACLDVLSLS